jgi:4-diphosphocytidyl-2-C-methyl-D-erythritol kinase
MDSLVLTSYGKINLALNVLEKRPEDGYHYVDMVMLPVTLADTVTLEPAAEISVACEPPVGGLPEANLAFKAAQLLRTATGYGGGAAIHIEKAIPVAGGMAGGSTNAAAVLRGLNQLWGTGLSDGALEELAIKLGSDVPFFVRQRAARVQGIGERLTPLAVGARLWFVVATPNVAKSTGNVYRLFDELEQVQRPDVDAMAVALAAGETAAIAAALGNVFEQVMLPRHPEIAELRSLMVRCGAVGALMSGAGPTVFGLVPDQETGMRLKDKLGYLGHRAFLVRSAG